MPTQWWLKTLQKRHKAESDSEITHLLELWDILRFVQTKDYACDSGSKSVVN